MIVRLEIFYFILFLRVLFIVAALVTFSTTMHSYTVYEYVTNAATKAILVHHSKVLYSKNTEVTIGDIIGIPFFFFFECRYKKNVHVVKYEYRYQTSTKAHF